MLNIIITSIIKIPFEAELFGININIHFITEYIAFFTAFRYYIYLRKNTKDSITNYNRLLIILGAALGALLGSRFLAILENPNNLEELSILKIYKSKTIIGGLLGGLFMVELMKKIIGEKSSSGDLFVLPIIIGIIIGRIGCFFTGVNEPTYGIQTDFFLGMNLGDGIKRHPTSLYEIIFLIVLFFIMRKIKKKDLFEKGVLFKLFMLMYFSFRIFIETIKPTYFYEFGLSSIQIACIGLWMYYIVEFIIKKKNYAK